MSVDECEDCDERIYSGDEVVRVEIGVAKACPHRRHYDMVIEKLYHKECYDQQ